MTTLLDRMVEEIRVHKLIMSFYGKESSVYIGVFMTRSCLFNLAREMTPGYNPPAVVANIDIQDIEGCPIFVIDSTVFPNQPPEFTVAVCNR